MNIMISGASRGIGKAIALEFARNCHPCSFLLTFNVNYKMGLIIQKEIERLGSKTILEQLNVMDRTRIREIISKYISEYGMIDILINNVGIAMDKTVVKMTDEEWDRVLGVNLTGLFNVTREAIRHMRDGGCIINMTSIAGLQGGFGISNYASSKAGVIAFTKSLAKELSNRNIRVNAIASGFVKDTGLIDKIPIKYQNTIKERILLKRFAEPEEIAKLVVFLSTKGTYCTGSVYIIDGGFLDN